MVLHPLEAPAAATPEIVSAWEAVFRTQQQHSSSYWLIAQPDHAALAGDLAANFSYPEFPELTPEVVQAIALHDAGWAALDIDSRDATASSGQRDAAARPLSFLYVPPKLMIDAWDGSIQRAEEVGPIGGLLVGGHFRRLGAHRLTLLQDPPETVDLLRDFVGRQEKKDEERLGAQSRTKEEVEALIDTLQFCDLLSLYLCCGARENVRFPQTVGRQNIVLQNYDGQCRLHPSPFSGELSLGVAARRDPPDAGASNTTTLAFLLR